MAILKGTLSFGAESHVLLRGIEVDDAAVLQAVLFNPAGVTNCCSLKCAYVRVESAAASLTAVIRAQGSLGEKLDLDIGAIDTQKAALILDVPSLVRVQGSIRSAVGVSGSNGVSTSFGCVTVDFQELDLPTGSTAFEITNAAGEIASYLNKLTCGTVSAGPGTFNYNALRETLI